MTWLNGRAGDFEPSLTVDRRGDVYVTGWTGSRPEANPTGDPFPWSVGAFKAVIGPGGAGGFVTRLDTLSGALVYSAFVAGPNSFRPRDIAVEPTCESGCAAYYTGITGGAFLAPPAEIYIGQPDPTGQYHAFVGKLDGTGANLNYLTRIGGPWGYWANALTVDPTGRAYFAGATGAPASTPLPCNEVLFTGVGENALVATLEPDGLSLSSCTYLGGVNGDQAFAIALDSIGDVYVAGWAQSIVAQDFPTTPGAFQRSGVEDVFVTKLTGTGEPGGSRIQFPEPAFRVEEDAGPAVVTVTRTGFLDTAVTVDYSTAPDTATSPADYTAITGTLSFGPGETALAFTVPIANDSVSEPDERFRVSLTNPAGGLLGYQATATVSIGDDDHTSHLLSIRDRVLDTGPNWTATPEDPWLLVSESTGSGPSTITVSVDVTGLPPGLHTSRIRVTGDTGDSPQFVPVTLTVLP